MTCDSPNHAIAFRSFAALQPYGDARLQSAIGSCANESGNRMLLRYPNALGGRGFFAFRSRANRARTHLAGFESVLMDRHTLHRYRNLGVEEKSRHGAESLPHLSESVAEVYQVIKRNDWGTMSVLSRSGLKDIAIPNGLSVIPIELRPLIPASQPGT